MTTSTNQVEINSELLAEARQMDIDAVNVAERALMREIKARRDEVASDEAARAWQEQNAEAIAWSNKRFEEHGFPFPQYRRY
jgi:antitoxin CcdA